MEGVLFVIHPFARPDVVAVFATSARLINLAIVPETHSNLAGFFGIVVPVSFAVAGENFFESGEVGCVGSCDNLLDIFLFYLSTGNLGNAERERDKPIILSFLGMIASFLFGLQSDGLT
ncbi:hypothetical protein A2572_03310 [Candidatus Collierbacteria bacterium RIFOXYD1_FULL_40_9]|uniref:Uncharacterized protein n=1 Tax=Candidatus Collierbacteria bacterium RIFOXYD1_FULL_40_9 TaxID=1817731 RepID=A0A1F5FWY4_9BACT|nr:MAG: hypothetical protein A2572_03310 [Candidatus Collierbacteria bacterium RIFOXYD1_FULL_40_9]